MRKINWNRILFVFLIAFIAFNILTTIFQYSSKYLSADYWERYPQLKKMYESSQYVNKNPEGWIADEEANSYAGGALIKGTNPIYIIADTPPLGKYLIGLSALIFKNENIITLLCYLIDISYVYNRNTSI